MSMDTEMGNGSKNLKHAIEVLKYRTVFRTEHPDYFGADGLLCFTGAQGQGKTLSAVNYVCNLMKKYPKAKLVTNLMLKDFPIVTMEQFYSNGEARLFYERLEQCSLSTEQFQKVMYQHYLQYNRVFPFNDNDDLSRYNNGEMGVIFLIDEILEIHINQCDSRCSVNIIIAINQNLLSIFVSPLDTSNCFIHIFHQERIVQML